MVLITSYISNILRLSEPNGCSEVLTHLSYLFPQDLYLVIFYFHLL